jgi:CDP-diglyceride synthetase
MKKYQLFLWGCFGAVLPELLRFFKLVTTGQPLPNLNWPLYGSILFLFVLAAGAFAIAWNAENSFKAIWVGASFPTLVAALIQVAPSLPQPPGH